MFINKKGQWFRHDLRSKKSAQLKDSTLVLQREEWSRPLKAIFTYINMIQTIQKKENVHILQPKLGYILYLIKFNGQWYHT